MLFLFAAGARIRRAALCGLGLLASGVLAAEHVAAAPAEPPPSSMTAADKAPVASKVAASAAASAAKPAEERAAAARTTPGQDPMDRLRERLAQRLGAAKPPGSDSADTLRIVSKANTALPGDLLTTPSSAHAALAHRRPRPAIPPQHAEPMSGLEPGHVHWDYAGAGGPDAWGALKPEFNKCASGTRQSPIDIRDGIRVELDPVTFDYKPSSIRVVDNGHTVQVDVAPGNSIEVLGRHYDLIQFHFHRPSEERINGRQFDMVVHMVHRDLDGRLAVIAVLLDRGIAMPAVQTVWNNLPLEKGDEVAARTLLDPSALLPASRSYYTYMGSLTTPPCSEGVLWMVMKTPMTLSADQVAIFSRLYPMNARPIQASSGRLIKESY